jgi:hypothetical protein
MVGEVVPPLVIVPESSCMASDASGSADERSGEGMDERDVAKYVSRARAQVTMEVPAGPGAVGGAGGKPRVTPLAAGGEAQAANKFSEHFSEVIMAALDETTEPVAAEDVRDVVAFHGMTPSARPGVAEGGERADAHADTGRVLERLVVQAEGGGIGDGVEPHAAGSGGDAVQEGTGQISGRKMHQLSVVCVVEGAANECGQLSALGGSWCGEVRCGMGADIRKAAVNLPPGREHGSMGGCEGVQVGGGSRECSGSAHCRGKKDSGAIVGGSHL